MAEQLEIHAELQGEPHLITQEKMVAFERVVWQRPPNVHSDPAAAKQEGMPRMIASGQNVLALLHRLLHTQFGDGWIRGGTIRARWVGTVFVGDVITPFAQVEQITQHDGRRRAELAVWCVNQDGKKTAVGKAQAYLDA